MSLFDQKVDRFGNEQMDSPMRSLYAIPLEPYRRDSLALSMTLRGFRELYPFHMTVKSDLLELSYRDILFLKERISETTYCELKDFFLKTWKINIDQLPSNSVLQESSCAKESEKIERESIQKHEDKDTQAEWAIASSSKPKQERRRSPSRGAGLEEMDQVVGIDDKDVFRIKDGDDESDEVDANIERTDTELSGSRSVKSVVAQASTVEIEAAIAEDRRVEFTLQERLNALDSLSYFPLDYVLSPIERIRSIQSQSNEVVEREDIDIGSSFYEYALDLLRCAGHVTDIAPAYKNHSAERVVFFDLPCSVGLSEWDRKLLNQFTDVSELFSIKRNFTAQDAPTAIRCFSLEVSYNGRSTCELISQIAKLLCKVASSAGVIVLAKCENRMTFAFSGYGINNVLSDWFWIGRDTEELIEKINIANMSCRNTSTFFFDFIYSIARSYYFYNPRVHSYIDIPSDYLDREGKDYSGKDEIKRLLAHLSNASILQYGDDYLEIEFTGNEQTASTSDSGDLDMLLLDIDLDSDVTDEGLDMNMEQEMEAEYEEFESESGISEDEGDLEEYEYLPQEIFDDPLLMVEHLKKSF